MTCQYCRAQNDIDTHRCGRCGRRVQDRVPVQMTAAVPDLEMVEMPAPPPAPLRPQLVTEVPHKRGDQPSQPAYQASLFGPIEARRSGLAQTASARTPTPRTRRDHSRQQKLEFHEARLGRTSVEASVYCGAPVAITAHRVMAAIVDSVVAIAAMGVFLATLQFAGVDIVFAKRTWPAYVGAVALISLFYRALFCIANGDTPGVRWTGLQILDFDGRTPTRRQRWYRLLGGCVGAIAIVGLIWAIFDQERLTWHDHMSQTFPTPRFQ